MHRALIKPGELLQLPTKPRDGQRRHARPQRGAKAHGARQPVHDKLPARAARAQVPATHPALRKGQAHNLGMRGGAAQGHNTVDSHRQQLTRVKVKHGGSKWTASAFPEVAVCQLQHQPHA
eukprot:CAMPEP_0177659792 /NCGR_PEP_ID=MMETSP0447-20121125/17643_1 /TAXON_ID=0 /ORGANISM="Stygamoeba regulata, Strain BSH-02190019" /LENGTH=120 /DNA_ID=CAMNT_0019164709 /DNA_START=464 /DNA_END=823 /DNA_ORIENTATION=+